MTVGKSNMPIDLKAALELFSDVIDKIMIVAGFFFLIIAVALFSKAYQWFSAASLLLGVLLIVVGTIVHFESFTLKVPSREGWGTVLVCVSSVFMASAVIVSLFAVPSSIFAMPTSYHRGADYIILVSLTRPNAWLAPILVWVGIGLLVLGIVLKFSEDIF
jgi:hypothetical protein